MLFKSARSNCVALRGWGWVRTCEFPYWSTSSKLKKIHDRKTAFPYGIEENLHTTLRLHEQCISEDMSHVREVGWGLHSSINMTIISLHLHCGLVKFLFLLERIQFTKHRLKGILEVCIDYILFSENWFVVGIQMIKSLHSKALPLSPKRQLSS